MMAQLLSWLLLIVGLLALAYALHRTALLLERKGWLFYTHRRPRISLGVALGAALDPALRRILEAQQREYDLEEDESGDGLGSQGTRNGLFRVPGDHS